MVWILSSDSFHGTRYVIHRIKTAPSQHWFTVLFYVLFLYDVSGHKKKQQLCTDMGTDWPLYFSGQFQMS